MAFNINEMKASLTGGGAKSTLFEVSITNVIDGTADALVPFMVHGLFQYTMTKILLFVIVWNNG